MNEANTANNTTESVPDNSEDYSVLDYFEPYNSYPTWENILDTTSKLFGENIRKNLEHDQVLQTLYEKIITGNIDPQNENTNQ